jgi:hypothetical protein
MPSLTSASSASAVLLAANADVAVAIPSQNEVAVESSSEDTVAIAPQAWLTAFNTVDASENERGVKSRAAHNLGVSKPLFTYHFKRYKEQGVLPQPKVGAPTRLPPEVEAELVLWAEDLLPKHASPERGDLQKKAKQLAEKHGIDPQTVGGEKWIRLFLNRHQHLTLKWPQQVEAVRATATSTSNLTAFYENVASQFKYYPPSTLDAWCTVDPNRVYNMDECAVSLKNMRNKVSVPERVGSMSLQAFPV